MLYGKILLSQNRLNEICMMTIIFLRNRNMTESLYVTKVRFAFSDS
jgi:hypothetical protein